MKDILKYKGHKDADIYRYLASLKKFVDPMKDDEPEDPSSHDMSSTSTHKTRTKPVRSTAKEVSKATTDLYKDSLKNTFKHLRDFDHMTSSDSGWKRPYYHPDVVDDYFEFLSIYSSGKSKDKDISTSSEFIEKVLDNLFVCPSILC